MARDSGMDTDSFTPAYFQLAQILYRGIMTGELRPGDRVPSENELSERYGLSRMTARKAISVLTDKGLVRRDKGRGTFVSKPKVEGGLFLIPDFHDEMRRQGISSDVTLLGVKVVPAGSTPAKKLGIRKTERIIYLERVLEGDGEPLVFDRKYILLDRTQPLLEAELVFRPTGNLTHRERRGAAPARRATESYSVSTMRERNVAGVDAAALECQGICGTEH